MTDRMRFSRHSLCAPSVRRLFPGLAGLLGALLTAWLVAGAAAYTPYVAAAGVVLTLVLACATHRALASVGEKNPALHALMARLQESESRFRGAMSVMAEGLAVLSAEGDILLANRAAAEILGYSESALQKLNIRQLPLAYLDDNGEALA